MQPATRRRTAVEAVVEAVEATEAANETETVETTNVVGRGAYVPPPLPPVNKAEDEAMLAAAARRASEALSPTTPIYGFAAVAGRVLKVHRVQRTFNNGFEGIVLESELSDGTRIRVSSTSAVLRSQFRNIPDGPVSPPITGRATLVESRTGQPAHELQ